MVTETELLTFKEDQSSSYAPRTYTNARADVTLAFAIDFTTAGEVLTKKACLANGGTYVPITLDPELFNCITISKRLDKIVTYIKSFGRDVSTINIAGNGVYTLDKYGIGQPELDQFVLDILFGITGHFAIHSTRNGGQTGADEAGGKASAKLGVPCTILSPKGWKLRGKDGRDICNEQLFKARFTI